MAQESITLEKPTVHLMHMLVFTLVVAILGAVLFPAIRSAFMANPGLNGLIVVTLVLGMLYSFRMVWRLSPEVNRSMNSAWANPSKGRRLCCWGQWPIC